mmetsp:Transcript_67016/g.218168  ORF Transcript_67016/g.218168 Transcript_67016/m.218168 type:complete len:140 (-) Transcript_67016:924-1343(-)
MEPSTYSLPCFSEAFTYTACCDLRLGVRGNESCWSNLDGAEGDVTSGEAFQALSTGERYHYTRCCLDRVDDLFLPCLYCSWAAHHTCLLHLNPQSIGHATGPWSDATIPAALPGYCASLCCGAPRAAFAGPYQPRVAGD